MCRALNSARARPGGPGYVSRGSAIVGYLCAVGAGATWGTTGPLSTASTTDAATSIGFWRILIARSRWGCGARVPRDMFRVDAAAGC